MPDPIPPRPKLGRGQRRIAKKACEKRGAHRLDPQAPERVCLDCSTLCEGSSKA